ncbi:MAG: T9SS type A sorting domain-containing protein [Sphingobacteriaceae bacterium]|nr:T9SS type A sorting domain-containing protein [Sphingobacteriaceae bacterium]
MNKIYFLLLLLMSLNGVSQSWNPAHYCTPSVGIWAIPCSQPGPSNTSSNFINDFINGFTTTGAVLNINNINSGCNGLPNNYIFYCNHPLQVNAGQTVSCSVQSASVWASGYAIFIDWNQDNIFQIPSERVAFSPSVPPAGTWYTSTFTVPLTQSAGVYRMRLRNAWATPGGGMQPCAMYGYGESEDYNVFVGTSPPPANPITATASPNQTICIGQNANLSVSYTGTSSTTFDWGGPNSFTSSIQNPTVVNTTTASNGFYYVSLSSATCPVMAITHVYVDPGPSLYVSASNSVICAGATVALTASGSNNYTWTPVSSTNSVVIVSPSITTIYTVASTATTNCIGTNMYTVTVNQGPTVNVSSSNSVICIGGSATLSVNGANSYTWVPGSSTNTSIIISPTATTIYTVTGTATNNACSTKKTHTLLVGQLPVVNISSSNSIICAGGSATLSANGASSYTWTPGSSTNTSIVVSPSITTIYTVASTGTTGCVGTKMYTLSVNPCTGLNEWNEYNGQGFIYPSPFHDLLNIKIKEPLNIKILNSIGEVIMEKRFLKDESIDMSELSKGVYYMFIDGGSGKNPVKLIKD